jgi:hypothetical protein
MDTYGDIVHPDEISCGEGKLISSPNIFLVQIADMNVL